ncbi:probable iron binding protein from the HesB_IscA_SufA family [Geminocystis sp. NIES-3708]|uniref:HesB/IscA family protein n=1 Tax=Geminocystis sp. NIES-3708 TaxID=1615909 RepID=UPI0005FC9DB5|nr:iron-sulfur cluster assembly accessory protein [Geminocystis sp. NIES-3708]BAQ61370.1 probable iron binding protein from the HesB_IscA_SufA family [Geminocystis sp. NIES-3708]
MINLTQNAVAELKRLRAGLEPSKDYIRLQIKKGGCADYVYELKLDSQPQKEDHQFALDSEIKIIVDSDSYQYLQNLTIDYTEDLMGGAFQYKNPNIVNHCTCGLSFSLS